MITTSNFQSIRLLRNWCMLTLPTVFNDALSYNEQVCKLTEALNQQGEIIKGLPEYIEQIVKELLEQAGLEDIVKQVLADYFFINVKNPPAPLAPAIGDGVANDTVAIQAMINYVAGKPNYLFFPAGTYSVQGLTMIDGVSLIGLDRFKTILMLRPASNKDLLTGDLGNCTIANIMLNANMPGQTANCSVFSGNVNDMMIGNVIFKNGYNMLSLDVNGTVQMDNVVFDGVQGNGLSIGGVKAMVNNIEFIRNSALNAGTLLTISGNNNSITGLVNTEFATTGVSISGNQNVVEGWVSGTTTPLADTGVSNQIKLYTGSDSIVKNNNVKATITGSKQETISLNKDENITGNKGVTIGGSYTETLIGSHTTNAGEEYTVNCHNAGITASDTATVSCTDVVLNPTNPLTYKAPQILNDYFKYVEFKNDGIPYKVLVAGDEILNIGNPFNTVMDMIAGTMESGLATCLGYYTVGDSIPLYYIIQDTGTADGGSVIALNNGKFAHAIFGEAITPNSFGIIGQPADLATRWTNYMTYVNGTAGKYYYLPDMLYYTPITLHVTKSIIGNINKTEIQTNAVIPNVPGETVGAVLWLDNTAHFSTSNLECKHIYINSTTGIGLYIKSGTAYDVQNVTINNATWIGFYCRTAWHSQFRDMFISSEAGAIYNLAYHYNDTSSNGTTCVFENIYSSGKASSGYYFGKLQYSSLINLSNDSLPGMPDTIYTIFNSTVDISGIGAEQMSAKSFITMTNSNVNISAISMESVKLTEYVFVQYGGGNLTVDCGYIPTPTGGKLVHLDAQTATVYSVINWNLTKAVDKANIIVATGNVVYTAIINGYNEICVGSNTVPLKSLLTV